VPIDQIICVESVEISVIGTTDFTRPNNPFTIEEIRLDRLVPRDGLPPHMYFRFPSITYTHTRRNTLDSDMTAEPSKNSRQLMIHEKPVV